MSNYLQSVIVRLAVMLCAFLPVLADTEFKVSRMTRDDVPLGKGQCDIRLRIDNEAEVSVRGDRVGIRTISGRDGRDAGSECNEPLPAGNIEGFNFEVRDGRGEIVLLSEPSRRNSFHAIVRIRDKDGGEGRYHFRLSWRMDGGRRRSGSRPGDDRGDRRWAGSSDLSSAIEACQGAVSERIAAQYGYDEVDIRNVRTDNGPGRNDSIVGEAAAIGPRGRAIAAFTFVCRVDFSSGRVRTVDVRRR